MRRLLLEIANPLHRRGGYCLPHLTLAILVKILVGLLVAAVAVHIAVSGGYKPGPKAPTLHIGGAAAPSSSHLERYSARIHDQGTTNSCVAQTLSTMVEIYQARRYEHAHRTLRGYTRTKYSAGFIFNQIDGGVDRPTTYQDAFGVLVSRGEAPLSVFPYDGTSGFTVWPSAAAFRAAYPQHTSSWRTIATFDRATIEYEISHGNPLAIAIPVYSSFINHWHDARDITGQSGPFEFWHSMTIVGYSPRGVEIQNSWGTAWGYAGRSTMTWSALAHSGGVIAVSHPAVPFPKPAHSAPAGSGHTHLR